MADTSSGRLAFIKEVTVGVIPATPTFLTFDFVSETLSLKKNNIRSNTVASNRMVKGTRATSAATDGSINFELSKGAETDQLIESLCGNAWVTNVVKVGGSTIDTLAFERKLSAAMYRRYVGSRVASLDLTIVPEQYVQGVFTLAGSSMTTGTAIIAGATYTAAAVTEKLTSLDVATVTVTGITGTFDFAQLQIKIDNGLVPSKKVGPTATRSIRNGQCVVTGTLQVYVDSNAFQDAHIAETPFAIAIQMLNGATGYTLTIPNARITNYSDANNGNGNEFIASIEFEGIYDGTALTSASFTRV